ncbi:unnamed protein product, partial [Rotaria socialis]
HGLIGAAAQKYLMPSSSKSQLTAKQVSTSHSRRTSGGTYSTTGLSIKPSSPMSSERSTMQIGSHTRSGLNMHQQLQRASISSNCDNMSISNGSVRRHSIDGSQFDLTVNTPGGQLNNTFNNINSVNNSGHSYSNSSTRGSPLNSPLKALLPSWENANDEASPLGDCMTAENNTNSASNVTYNHDLQRNLFHDEQKGRYSNQQSRQSQEKGELLESEQTVAYVPPNTHDNDVMPFEPYNPIESTKISNKRGGLLRKSLEVFTRRLSYDYSNTNSSSNKAAGSTKQLKGTLFPIIYVAPQVIHSFFALKKCPL